MKAEEEYQLALKYLDELKKVYDDEGKLILSKERDAQVIVVWRDLIEKAVEETGNRDETYLKRFSKILFKFSSIL